MSVKIAINGFARIGRLAYRQIFDMAGYEVVAIKFEWPHGLTMRIRL